MSFHTTARKQIFIIFPTENFLSGWTRSSYQSSRCFNEKLNVSTTAHTKDAKYSPPHSLISAKTIQEEKNCLKAMRIELRTPENIRQFNICRITFPIFEPFPVLLQTRPAVEGKPRRKPTGADGCKLFPQFHLIWKWTESTAFEPFFDLPATVEFIQAGRLKGGVVADLPSVGLGGFSSPADTPRPLILNFKSEWSFSENFASTLISIWLEAIGTLSWTYHCTHSQYSRSQKSQAINYHKSEFRCINFVCFRSGKFSFPKSFVFLGDEL